LRLEKLQFDNFTSLSNAIQLLYIVAWQLFLLKKAVEENTRIELEEILELIQL